MAHGLAKERYDDPGEVLFLFRIDDLNHCKQKMNRIHAQAL